MTKKKTDQKNQEEFEVRFVKTDTLGKATGSVFHWTECGMVRNVKPDQRATVEEDEIKLLGLQPCTRCYRLTHQPEAVEGLSVLKTAVRTAIEEIHRGRKERAEEILGETLAFVEGRGVRPEIVPVKKDEDE